MSAQEGDVIETITLQVRAGDGSGGPLTVKQASTEEAQDVWAYRLAVGAVGAGLVAFLIGAAVIAAVGKTVPSQYWTTGSAISGALLGILAPNPKTQREETLGDAAKKVIVDLWNNRAVLILLLVFGLAVWRDIEDRSTEWQTLAAAAGGALIGLLAPSPSKKG